MPAFDKGKKLTPLFIDSQVKKKGKGRYALGDMLYLNVSPTGKRSYIFRYQVGKKVTELGLGSATVTSLLEAREMIIMHRKLIRDGIDPKAEKKRKLKAATPVATFKQFAENYIDAKVEKTCTELSTMHWRQSLRDFAYPFIGSKTVDEVVREDMVLILSQETMVRGSRENGPLWEMKNETASRLRRRIQTILEVAKNEGQRKGDNPAEYKHNLDSRFPIPKNRVVRHHPALPYRNLPEFMVRLRELESMSARALEFCILTATRTSETLGAVRSEFDFINNIWTIPAKRMKAGREHRIPLSPKALACLPDHNRDVMFTGHSANQLSNMAMTMCLRGIADGAFMAIDETGDTCLPTVHGFRSCFRDWTAEQTGFAEHACEIALAHNPKGAVEAAYNRTDYLGMRRVMMNHWADYADGNVPYIDPHADDGAEAYEHLKRPVSA